MSPLSIENAAASAAATARRTAAFCFADDERSDISFDKQLRNALESESSRRASRTEGNKKTDKDDASKDRDKIARSNSREEREDDSAVKESTAECLQETTDAQAAENPDEISRENETSVDENGNDANDTQAAVAGAQAAATLQDEAVPQNEFTLLEPTSSGESSQAVELQVESSGILTTEETPDAANTAATGEQTSEVELGKVSLQVENEAQAGKPNESNRKETAIEATQEISDTDVAAKVAAADGNAAVQNIASVAEGESGRQTKRPDTRGDSSRADADAETPQVQTPAPSQSAATPLATLASDLSALEDVTKPAAETFKSAPGEIKTAAAPANPAETALGQRLADAREGRASAAASDSADANSALDRAKFVQRVAKAFEGLGSEGGTLRIRLHPAELGSLRLEVAMRNGALTARLETETTEAKNILLDNLPALRERLAGQNIKIERFDVDYSGGNPNGSSQGSGDYQDSGQRTHAWRQESQTRTSDDGNSEKVHAAPSPRRPGAKSRLDFVA